MTPEKLRSYLIPVVVAIVVLAPWAWWRKHPEKWSEYERATQVIATVEQYRSSHGNLPPDFRDWSGSFFQTPVEYTRTGANSYTVSFVVKTPTRYTYNSISGKWSFTWQ
jgi:hypothetical protein